MKNCLRSRNLNVTVKNHTRVMLGSTMVMEMLFMLLSRQDPENMDAK